MSVNFTASWMLVAQWDKVHPYPHGTVGGGISEQYGNFLDSVSYRCIIAILFDTTFLLPIGKHLSSHCDH